MKASIEAQESVAIGTYYCQACELPFREFRGGGTADAVLDTTPVPTPRGGPHTACRRAKNACHLGSV
jgi:hypothetical protein